MPNQPRRLCIPPLVTVQALYLPRPAKPLLLTWLNLLVEQLRVLWRLVHERHWISQQQLLYVNERFDEIGRLTGRWLHQLARPPQ